MRSRATGPRLGDRKRIRAGVIATALIALTAILAACGGGDSGASSTTAATTEAAATQGSATTAATATGGGDYKIAFFTDSEDNSYLKAGIAGAQEVAQQNGVTLDVISAGWDANKQLTQVQDAIAGGQYDALVVESVDGEVLCDDLTAAAKDMVVSIFNAPICGNYKDLYTEGTVGFFGPDNYQLGQLMGEQIATALNGKGTVGYVSGPVQVGIVGATTDGLKAKLAEYPDIELVAELDGAWDAAKGLAATQDLITAHPDVDGIVYGVDQMAVPSIEWLQESKNLNDRLIVTLGGSEEGFQLIKDGVIYSSVNSLPKEEAAYGVQGAIDTLNGQEISVPGWDAARKVYNTVEDPNVPGIVNKDNVDSTPAEWSL